MDFCEKYVGTCLGSYSTALAIDLVSTYKKLLTKYLKKNAKVLDLGAGRLPYKKMLLAYSKNYKSIDFEKTHEDLDYIGTASNTGLKDNSFDVIFCSQVLEHVPDPYDSFKEMNRILKKGGIAIISVPFLMYLHQEPYDFFRYTKYALRKMSEDSNFKVVQLIEVGGLFSFIGSVFAKIFTAFLWKIYILKYLFFVFNSILQYILFLLDKITPFNKRKFPHCYLLVIEKV